MIKTVRKKYCWLLSILSIFLLSGCVSIVRIDGPYKGKVVDSVTNQPIEGAVIHGEWWKAHLGAGGSSHTYHDSCETLTDKNGEFKMSFKGLRVLTMITDMNLTILKAGYEQFSGSEWNYLKEWRHDDRVTWKEGHVIIKLKKLTLQERRERIIHLPLGEPTSKQRLLRIEYNNENAEIGRPQNTILPVE